jgi:hypothetical protein
MSGATCGTIASPWCRQNGKQVGALRTILNDGSEVVMSSGARTPEELETLFEDTLVLRDGQALAALFEDRAVLVAEHLEQARGGAAIAPLALERWSDQRTYVANPQWVVQTHDLALIVGERVIHVAHRGRDGAWRYAITLVPRDSPSAQPERAGDESIGDGGPAPVNADKGA